MVWNEIVSMICVFCSASIFSYSLLRKSKKNILWIQIMSGILYTSSYFVLIPVIESALIGGAVALVEFIRIIAFYLIEKYSNQKKKILNLVVGLFFVIVIAFLSKFTWTSWVCVFPLVGGVIVGFALCVQSVLTIKICYLIQTTCAIIYLFLMSLYFNGISQIFVLIVGFCGLIITLRKRLNSE